MKKSVIALLVIGMLAIAGTSMAATQTSNIQVTANVAAACSVVTTAAVAFGAYDPTSAANNDAGQGSMSFSCTKGTAYKTYITGVRSMAGGGDTLNFQLFTDNTRATTFPSTSVTGTPGTAADALPILVNIYGRIPGSQNVGVASYTATLVAVVEY
jgi:spore coat protein U-like protein